MCQAPSVLSQNEWVFTGKMSAGSLLSDGLGSIFALTIACVQAWFSCSHLLLANGGWTSQG